MKRPIGYSTGALARSDFARAVDMLRRRQIGVVELSALRDAELIPLLKALETLDLSFARYVSFHAPSRLEKHSEMEVAKLLRTLLPRRWPIILHPDVVTNPSLWQGFGASLCIENMDKRKAVARTVAELAMVFRDFPDATFCFDIGHARQVDPTMGQAELMLEAFGGRLRQVHMSEVNSRNGHDPISVTALRAFRKVAWLVPAKVPIVLEPLISEELIETQMALADEALATPRDEAGRGTRTPEGVAR
jgi:hypothetical protein